VRPRGLVGTAKYYLWLSEGPGESHDLPHGRDRLEIVLGYLTFTGSLLAAGKLQSSSGSRSAPSRTQGQNFVNLGS
jgi:NAD(P) transhydrogenase subunit beta